jgi:heme/copper-type cytochrome/quinol oxidase subunit 2
MTWLWILIGIAVVVYVFSLLSGESKEDSAVNAAGAAMVGGSCMLQIFLSVVGILIVLWVFSFLFG